MHNSHKSNQRGSHLLLIIIVLAVIALIGGIVYMFLGPKDSKYGYAWDFNPNDNAWRAVKPVPQCPSQILTMSPVDTSQVVSILWPGQYRGTNYKPHGGFRFANYKKDDTIIKLPFDAYLVNATKYSQTGNNSKVETQYILTFENTCGYVVMFDHLRVLDPEFTAIAEKGATKGLQNTESRFLSSNEKKFYKAGTVIATRVGFESDGNTSVDFGIYDLRKPNEISKDAKWANIHSVFAAQAFYAVCGIDLLPAADNARIKSILPTTADHKNASDYCSYAPGGTTLKYNDGKPVEGDAVMMKTN